MATLNNSSKINLRTVLFLASVTLIVSNCCALAHTDVTAEQARDLIDSTNDLVVVDVREPDEYCDAIGHIPGALNYPLSSGVLQARYEELPINGPVLVVCRSGARSNTAADFLDSKGFSMVYDMLGGMNAWIWETAPCKYGGGSGTTASAETNTYVFLTGQSNVVQTGGIAGVHETYGIEGEFQLRIDHDAGIASFEKVYANLTEPSSFLYTQSLDVLFNMTSLLGAVLDDTTISFTGKADDGSDVLITVTIEDDLAYLVGQTIPPPNTADFFLFSLDAAAQRKYGGGTGEPNNPYLIYTADQMNAIGADANDWDKHFKLMSDIDLSSYTGTDFNIIGYFRSGDDIKPFTGVFDGNGHIISNFSYTSTDVDSIALFGYVVGKNAVIKDLGLINPNVDAGTGSGVGSLVDLVILGTITNCYAEGGSVSGNEWVGGLVGVNNGIITRSYSTGTVSGNDYVGGLVGSVSGSITASYSTSKVTGNDYVGGLVGKNRVSIATSYSASTVTGNDYVGGLVGYNDRSITASYSTSTVTGNGNVGGLVGENRGSIATSYSTSTVTGNDYVGGLVGYSLTGSITSSFWDMEASGQAESAGGTGLSTAEMQEINTFLTEGWDFVGEILNGTSDYWQISPGDYPWLRYYFNYSPVMPEGLGTAEEPYLIRDARDLGTVWFKPLAHYRLEASVDLSGITWSMAVVPWFEGTFDGNGHTISHLTIAGVSYLGLFGRLGSGATISNLGLEAVDVNGIGDYIGGFVGYNDDGNITNSYSIGTVTGDDHVGGLVGSDFSGNITTSYSIGTVTGDDYVGGLVGGHNYGNITTSYSIGTVSGNDSVGGLVGKIHGGTITNCYSTASVSGNDRVGGLVGWNGYEGTITNCYSSGDISGNSNVGGLVGWNFDIIINCYATGSVSGSDNVGGLVGSNVGNVIDVYNSFWDVQTSGQSTSAGGTGKTTAEMQTESTFTDAGWGFVGESVNGTEDIWSICEGTNYPRLAQQIPAGDFVCPDGITIDDFVFFIEYWRDDNCDSSNDYCDGTDLDFSGTVDEADLEILIENWLESSELEN